MNKTDSVYDALLFDMDGTILTSLAAAERVWARWAAGHGLDVATFLPTMHGKRGIDTVRDSGVMNIDVEAEAAAILEAELDDVEGIEPIDGAVQFLEALPFQRWAVVTSAPRRLAERRIQAAGLPMPGVLVAGDDIVHGKPSPEGFLAGAEKLGCPIQNCLIFEDAPAGLQAARASGASFVRVTALEQSRQPTALSCRSIKTYHGIRPEVVEGDRIKVEFP